MAPASGGLLGNGYAARRVLAALFSRVPYRDDRGTRHHRVGLREHKKRFTRAAAARELNGFAGNFQPAAGCCGAGNHLVLDVCGSALGCCGDDRFQQRNEPFARGPIAVSWKA